MRRPLTVPEVADVLGMHPNSVRRISASELPLFRVGSRGDRRYDPADVLRYKNARREDGTLRVVA